VRTAETAFVVADNAIVYQRMRPAFESAAAKVSFFCSRDSAGTFAQAIAAGDVTPIELRRDWERLRGYDVGFSCHSKQIFPAPLVRDVRCINVHPGLNPYNRGWYPQVFSLINKLPLGVTIHEMDAEIDHGPIVCQSSVEIDEGDTSETVYQRLLDAEIRLFTEWLPALLRGDYTAVAPAAEGNYNSRADFEKLCEIDLDKRVTFREAIDFLRATSHRPHFNAFYRSAGGRVFVRLEVQREAAEPRPAE
jgi:dTDP-4-amino-4,6-dideoxyglucose formyltransferase